MSLDAYLRYLVEEFAQDYLARRMSRRDLLRRALQVTGSPPPPPSVPSARGGGGGSEPEPTPTATPAPQPTPTATAAAGRGPRDEPPLSGETGGFEGPP